MTNPHAIDSDRKEITKNTEELSEIASIDTLTCTTVSVIGARSPNTIAPNNLDFKIKFD
jgi:hypothetical protein